MHSSSAMDVEQHGQAIMVVASERLNDHKTKHNEDVVLKVVILVMDL